MPEHWQTLEILTKNERFDVRLSYNTNCSVLTYGGQNILDYWRKWDKWKIEVWPSIDEIGERAELIRSGTVWEKVEQNLIEMTKLDNITLRPGLTIGAWNVNRLPEIIEHLISLDVISKTHHYQNFFINLLEQPEHYHVSILNDEFREETIKKLKDFIVAYNKKYDTIIDSKFTQIIHELEKPRNLKALERFKSHTADIDRIRNEDIYKTIPELALALS
jgi:hypothetical protein